jgi:hypothetical protein
MKCVFSFSLQLLSETFLILRRTERDIIIKVQGIRVKCRIFLKLECSRQICEKYANIKFPENPSYGGRDVPCRLTDGRTDMTKLIVVFRNFANAAKISYETLNCI